MFPCDIHYICIKCDKHLEPVSNDLHIGHDGKQFAVSTATMSPWPELRNILKESNLNMRVLYHWDGHRMQLMPSFLKGFSLLSISVICLMNCKCQIQNFVPLSNSVFLLWDTLHAVVLQTFFIIVIYKSHVFRSFIPESCI